MRTGAWRSLWVSVLPLALLACSASPPGEPSRDVEREPVGEASSELVSYSCNTSTDTGYSNGNPFAITLVTVDGEPVEIETANAFLTMAQAAEGAGIALHINSGFRTMAQQEYFYSCFINCNCNDCNEAATPGYSNHQSGHALDINTGGGALNWLNANGGAFGFKRTVPSENWHWEWWGGGSPQPFCSVAPPSCDRSAAGFTFSCDGPESGMTCVNVNEPGDPDSWGDNHFCSQGDLGMQWSFNGPIAGMECVGVHEASENHAQAWADNFLCLPPQSPYILAFSSAGPIAGQSCVQWNEPADPNSWSDNHVCITARSAFSSGPFTFSGAGPVDGLSCFSVNEPSDPDTWADNYLCTRGDFGLQWSISGPLAGLTCTNVAEAADQHADIWADNFLCAPPQTPWTFSWSSAGAPPGASCVRWYEAADLAGSWGDNWLCYQPVRDFSAGGFTFSGDGPEAGKHCVNVNAPGDPDSWSDNHFCSDQEIGLKWSTSGPIAGMRCTSVHEAADTEAAAWEKTFLCVPDSAPVVLTWSSAGPLEGKSCVRWFDHDETSATWSDNWMCSEPAPPGTGGGGAAGAGGKGGSSGKGGGQAGEVSSYGGSGGDAAGAGPYGGSGGSKGGSAGKGGAAGRGGAAGEAPSGETLRLDGGESESSGGCAASRTASGGGWALTLGLLAGLRARRRREPRGR